MREPKQPPFKPYRARALLHGKHEDGTRGYPEVHKDVTVLSRKTASKYGSPLYVDTINFTSSPSTVVKVLVDGEKEPREISALRLLEVVS